MLCLPQANPDFMQSWAKPSVYGIEYFLGHKIPKIQVSRQTYSKQWVVEQPDQVLRQSNSNNLVFNQNESNAEFRNAICEQTKTKNIELPINKSM